MKATLVCVFLVVALIAGGSRAADIVWLPVQDFGDLGPGIIFEEGTVFEAVNTTTTGIFQELNATSRGEEITLTPVHNLQTSTTGDARFSPPTLFEDDTFNTLLGSHSWGPAPGDEFLVGDSSREWQIDLDQDPATTNDIVLTEGGFEPLTPGHNYAIQIFGVYDGRGCCAERETVFSDGRGLDFGSDKVTRGEPESVLGFFTADDTTQTIQVLGHPDNNTDPTLSFYIVFELTETGGGCDFDGDGLCGTPDINMLMNEVAANQPPAAADGGPQRGPSPFDLNNDGSINDLDRDEWLSLAATDNGLSAPYFVGDSNLDLRVNAADLNALGTNWQSDNDDWTGGNFTGADVGSTDLNELALNWQAVHPDAPLAASIVPEPASAVMLLIGLLGLAAVRR